MKSLTGRSHITGNSFGLSIFPVWLCLHWTELNNTRIFRFKKHLPEWPQPFVETRLVTLLSDTGMSRHDARVGVCSHEEVN